MLKTSKMAAPVCLALLGLGASAADLRPNIVLLYADDLGYGDLSCYGHPTICTPNIDALASEGVRMTSFYSGAAVSSPARAALLTGRYPVRSGMYGDQVSVLFPQTPRGLPTEEVTIAEMLSDAGYQTALIGKWHQGHAHPYLPDDHGFGYFYGVYSPHNYDILPLMDGETVVQEEAQIENLTQYYTEKACSYVRSHSGSPFFLMMSYNAPHLPTVSSEGFKGKSLAGRYGDMVEEMDWSVGQIMKALEEEGIAGRTLVVFTSDNGPSIPNTPFNGGSAGHLRGGKYTPWEGGFRMPAIFRFPGVIPSGSVCYGMGSQLDLLPTFAALGGAPLPEGVVLDGVDIMPMLSGQSKSVHEEFAYYIGSRLWALRIGKFKAFFSIPDTWYTQTPFLPDPSKVDLLLFDLNADPGEKRNLAHKSPGLVERFLSRYQEYLDGVNIAPPINDEYNPKNDNK